MSPAGYGRKAGTLAAAGALTLALARAGEPGSVGSILTPDGFASASRFYVHCASGFYWIAVYNSSGSGPVVLSSRTGASGTWISQSTVFSALVPTSATHWAVRFSGSNMIAIGTENSGPKKRWYRHFTLNGDGTVTPTNLTDLDVYQTAGLEPINALIAGAGTKPFIWLADGAPSTVGDEARGNQLSNPGAFTSVAAGVGPPTISNATVGQFSAGAFHVTGGADPDDFIVLRATTLPTPTANAHRLVATKFDASVPAYDSNLTWYNVSLNGCTACSPSIPNAIAESMDTEVKEGTDAEAHRRFAAVRDSSGNLHAVYVNRNDNVVHYMKDVGFNDTWSRKSVDVTATSAAIDRVALTALAGDGLLLYYSKSDAGIYGRYWSGGSGGSWDNEFTIKPASAVPLQGALASIELCDTCKPAVAWVEGSSAPFQVWFAPLPTAMFYSVGTRTTALYSGDASASNGTLTLLNPAPGNVGVGDEIRPSASSSRYYITGRQSPTVFTIQDSASNGGTPGATNITFGSQAIEIYRAFNLISSAVTGSMDGNHLGTSDLAGAGFQLNWPCYADAVMTDSAIINNYTTGPLYYIRLYTPVYGSQVGASQRHSGVFGTGFQVRFTNAFVIDNQEEHVRIEGLVVQLTGTDGFSPKGGIRSGTSGASDIRVSHNIVKGVISNSGTSQPTGIRFGTGSNSSDVHRVSNNIVYNFTDAPATDDLYGIQFVDGTAYVFNNTVFNCDIGFVEASSVESVQLTNNVSINDVFDPANRSDYALFGKTMASNNVSSDATGTAGLQNKNLPANYFQNVTLNSEDLHLRDTAFNLWGADGADLSSDANLAVTDDIGREGRIRPDHGADEFSGATAVTLRAFVAVPLDGAVLLTWETASELDNLGFHLYRATSGDGPWTRITAGLIRGLGSSPEGRQYSWTDQDLTNATTYHYRLEDVDRSGLATSHGPVSATPAAGLAAAATQPTTDASAAALGPGAGAAWTAYGEPSAFGLRVVRRTPSSLTLELTTGGFYVRAEEDGTARLHVPGFFELNEPGLPRVPTRRAWVDVPAGSRVRIASVVPADTVAFRGLELGRAGVPQAFVERGAYRAGFRRARARATHGLHPDSLARVLETAFQGETKKAYLELAPLRVDAGMGQVVLARKLVVRLVFPGRAARERSRGGSRGRLEPGLAARKAAPAVERRLARLASRSAGLHAVAFEQVMGGGAALSTGSLRLSRLGEAVAFHVEPRADRFGPGSTLYFVAAGPETAYGNETVYELAIGSGGVQMAVAPAPRSDAAAPVPALVTTRVFETNASYLPALLTARDPWFWDIGLLAPNGRDYGFTLAAPAAGAGPARLTVELHGGTDAATVDPDHQVRVLVNGVPLGEAAWDGLNPARFEASLDASILLEGANTLRLENLDTTGRFDSVIYLDRFAVEYPRRLVADGGRLEGRAASSGLVRAAGFPTGALLLDVTGAVPAWLTAAASGGEIAFAAESGKSYLAVSPEAVQQPEVRPAAAATLRSTTLQADWIMIAPRELLPAAEPLVAQRESQGLEAMAVPLEQVQDEFGYGERSPQMLRDFLAYAYHHWAQPSRRYVLLLGDATYDPKGYLPTATRKDLLPTPFVKSTFLWTASDPWLAAVNGEDAIPDLAIGRLSAGSLAEAEAAVQKILAFETSGQSLNGKAVLVADNPDKAGNFEANANDIASLLEGRPVERLFLRQLGSQTRNAVLGAFDAGAALVSYVGHGSQSLWASEAILRSIDVALLQPQARQPLMLTMTCSNGYFISPYLNGIAERFVLERDKGAIAAFSPSGLSLDEAAHLYHRALVGELESGRHERLGDLVLAAQKDYADTGAFPELLSLYHLFADPALRVR